MTEGNNLFDNGTDTGLGTAQSGGGRLSGDHGRQHGHLCSQYKFITGAWCRAAMRRWHLTGAMKTAPRRFAFPAVISRASRIEHRVAGADANIYLTVATMLAGALYGIENKLVAPAAVEGDAGEV